MSKQPMLFPAGHFYSPIVDVAEVRSREAEIWAPRKQLPGIDWNESGQLALLECFRPYAGEIEYPETETSDPTRYYYGNDQFPALDADVLFCMLRHHRPARMIEVGSGFSSLIAADVNRRFMDNRMDFTCIEPYPRQFLRDGVPGITRLLVEKVQSVDPGVFRQLKEGDVLFIDSSHVSKTGSDVNRLFLEILPQIQPGVLIHIHDIFLPSDYPRRWVIEEGRHWNEQYLVQAFLIFNQCFEIVWGSYFMSLHHDEALRKTFRAYPRLGGGGSLWIRRTSD